MLSGVLLGVVGGASSSDWAGLGLRLELRGWDPETDVAPAAIVVAVVSGSPAAAAGLRPRDIVVGLDGEPVAVPTDFVDRVSKASDGSVLRLRVLREGRERELEAVVADSRTYLGRACDSGEALACVLLARQFRHGFGVGVDEEQAIELLARVCPKGDPAACEPLGDMRSQRRNGAPAAFEALEGGCEAGDGPSCLRLALLHEGGYAPTGPDPALGYFYRQRSCRAGFGKACWQLGAATVDGAGVPRNPARGMELLEQGCRTGSVGACDLATWFISYGNIVDENPARVISLSRYSCAAGSMRGCAALGRVLASGGGGPDAVQEGVAAMRAACDAGHISGCTTLGRAYRDGDGVAHDYDRARQLFERGCDRGDPPACVDLAQLVSSFGHKEYALTVRLLRQTCDQSWGPGCFFLGLEYQYGRGLAVDDARALELYEKACELDDPDGCNYAGIMYSEGPTPRNDALAAQYLRRACEQNASGSCERLRELVAGR